MSDKPRKPLGEQFRTLDDPARPDLASLASGPSLFLGDRAEPVQTIRFYGFGRRLRETVRLLFTGRVRIS